MIRTTVAGVAAALACVAMADDAVACGGCFQPPYQASETLQVVTDHRMALLVSPTGSILWDQIRYAGKPREFSWVLPVAGDVRVEVASSDFFDELEAQTAPQVASPPVPPCGGSMSFGFGTGRGAPAVTGRSVGQTGETAPAVEVLRSETVGPYDTVLVRSADPMALDTWLTEHGYAIQSTDRALIEYYVRRGMDFIALRLRPGDGVQAMQPIRVRYIGANMVLPLRMVGAGVTDSVGITLWVFGVGRHEVANFGNAVINASDLVWDWGTNRSNYTDVFRTTMNATRGGRAWITEMAVDVNSVPVSGQYRGAGVVRSSIGSLSAASTYDWGLATVSSGTWVTRLRTDLAAQYLDDDLVLQASTVSTPVAGQFSLTREVGPRPEPICPSRGGVGAGGGVAIACAAAPARSSRGVFGPRGLALVAAFAGVMAWRQRQRAQRHNLTQPG